MVSPSWQCFTWFLSLNQLISYLLFGIHSKTWGNHFYDNNRLILHKANSSIFMPKIGFTSSSTKQLKSLWELPFSFSGHLKMYVFCQAENTFGTLIFSRGDTKIFRQCDYIMLCCNSVTVWTCCIAGMIEVFLVETVDRISLSLVNIGCSRWLYRKFHFDEVIMPAEDLSLW